MEIINETYSLSSLVNDVATMIRIRLEDKKVSLKTDVDPELPDKLYGDEGRIKQILINLLNNAVKFTNQGEITFTMGFSKMSEDRIRLLISVTEWNNKKKELDSSFAAEDWQTYKIVIHAMKSTSKMIGADGLSNGARELEIAAIDGNISYIAENHRQYMISCEKMVRELEGKLKDQM